MMVYHGTVRNGVVVFDEGETLQDGARVTVKPLNGEESCEGSEAGTLAQRLLELAGSAGPGLPSDLARNHDHYLYGTPKR